MLPSVDTRNPAEVLALAQGSFRTMFPGAKGSMLEPLFRDITALFTGQHPDYQANDLRYHDFQHTLQATVCLIQLLEGRHAAGVEPHIDARQFQWAIAGVLLHDSGYQRLRSDTSGTSAKYTFVHVLRSCAYAATYLPTLGATEQEIDGVLGAIRCTGPTSDIARLSFHSPLERTIGCALATADYLGQMAASDYPDELGDLYKEFKESYEFFRTPKARRHFSSARDLINQTPAFWHKVVLPKLENDFQAVYRFLARPYPHGPNGYLDGVERNIAKIQRRLQRTTRPTR